MASKSYTVQFDRRLNARDAIEALVNERLANVDYAYAWIMQRPRELEIVIIDDVAEPELRVPTGRDADFSIVEITERSRA